MLREGERGQRMDWVISAMVEVGPLCYRRNYLEKKLNPA